jgi:polar amino acid transport system substrate-binding protein
MRIALQFLLICLVTLFPKPLLAETYIAHCRNYPPELFFDGSKCVGVLPDLMSDIFSELGHNIKWIDVPWVRSIREAKKGNVDLLIRHSMTPKRKSILKPITYGYDTRHLSFYKSPRFERDIKSYEDLENVNIGAIRGVFYSPKFSVFNTNELSLVGKTAQLLAMLERGRIDVAVTSASHNEELFAQRFEKATFVDTFVNPEYISIPLNSAAMQIYDDVAELMLEYRKSGKIDLYFERYETQPPQQFFD